METAFWSGGDGVWSNCGTITVLHATGTATITSTHSLSIHYKVRILVSIWWFSGSTDSVTLQLATSANANIGSTTVTPAGTAGTIAGAAYDPYCANSKATNVDHEFTDNTPSVKVNFKANAASANWGLR